MPCIYDWVLPIWLAIVTLMRKAFFASSLLQGTLCPRVMLDWPRYSCGLGAQRKLSPNSLPLSRTLGQAFSSVIFEDWPSTAPVEHKRRYQRSKRLVNLIPTVPRPTWNWGKPSWQLVGYAMQ